MISRRSFFQRLLLGAAAFAILPPAETYLRIWRAQRPIIYPVTGISCAEFAQILSDEIPRFDQIILREMMLDTSDWFGKVETGIWPGMEENRLLQVTPGFPSSGEDNCIAMHIESLRQCVS